MPNHYLSGHLHGSSALNQDTVLYEVFERSVPEKAGDMIWSSPEKVNTQLSFHKQPTKVNRRNISQIWMSPDPIVEYLNVFEDTLTSLWSGPVFFKVYELCL